MSQQTESQSAPLWALSLAEEAYNKAQKMIKEANEAKRRAKEKMKDVIASGYVPPKQDKPKRKGHSKKALDTTESAPVLRKLADVIIA